MTWAEAEARWPGCSAAFDRDVGRLEDDGVQRVLRVRSGVILWADVRDCRGPGSKCFCAWYHLESERWYGVGRGPE